MDVQKFRDHNCFRKKSEATESKTAEESSKTDNEIEILKKVNEKNVPTSSLNETIKNGLSFNCIICSGQFWSVDGLELHFREVHDKEKMNKTETAKKSDHEANLPQINNIEIDPLMIESIESNSLIIESNVIESRPIAKSNESIPLIIESNITAAPPIESNKQKFEVLVPNIEKDSVILSDESIIIHQSPPIQENKLQKPKDNEKVIKLAVNVTNNQNR